MGPLRGGIVEKVWGREHVIVAEPEYTFKVMEVFPGYQCSLHFHKRKTETFVVYAGIVKLEHGAEVETLISGDSRKLPAGTPHRFSSEAGAIIYEISTFDSPEDSYRLETSSKIPAI